MAYVNKTFVVPEFAQAGAQNQTPIDQETGLAQGYGSFLPWLLMGSSNKPVKNRQVQVTTPYARPDMIAARDTIGRATQELDDYLKGRETLGYTMASAMAGVPKQEGYGSWLSDFARGFGSAAKTPVDMLTSRAERKYENQMKDLAERLAYDKSMGGTVETDLGYFYPETSNNDALLFALLLGNK